MAKKGLYIHFFDGHVLDQIEGCGRNGPVFGPFEFVELTHGPRITLQSKQGRNELNISEQGLIYYDGFYHETVSVVSEPATDAIIDGHQRFDPAKAITQLLHRPLAEASQRDKEFSSQYRAELPR